MGDTAAETQAEPEALSVVHADVIDRIVRRVERSSAAGRYLAIGASASMRERVHGAFRARLGAERVVVCDLSGIDDDPWNAIRERHAASGLPTRGTLYVAYGLKALRARGRASGRPEPYGQLNLARDAWGATGLHLLVWLEGMRELDAFLDQAPDVWSHRDVVAWFLSRADFLPEGPAPAPLDPFEPRIRAAEATLARSDATAVERVLAAAELAECLGHRAQPERTWQALMLGEQAARGLRSGDEEAAEARWWLQRARVIALLGVQRRVDAARSARTALATRAVLGAWDLFATEGERCRALPLEERCVALGNLLAHDLGQNRSVAAENLSLALAGLGRIAEARSALLEAIRSGLEDAHRRYAESGIAVMRGDRAVALREGEAGTTGLTAQGADRIASFNRQDLARLLDDLGSSAEAEALLAAEPDGDRLVELEWRAAAFAGEWRCAAPRASGRLADLNRRTRTLLPEWPARAYVVEVVQQLMSQLDENATPDDPTLPVLDTLLRDARRLAREDKAHDRDPEVVGACDWLRARLALVRGDRPAAWKLADGVIVPWARRWRGRVAEVAAWRTLARAAPTPARAAELAAHAVQLADDTLSRFAQIQARETLAEIAAARGDIPAAVAALHAAQAIARSEGLHDDEIRLLHALAELPGYTGAQSAASDALVLARAQMLPREEARALLNLALLDPSHGRAAARRFERAAALTEALGPPRLLARIAHARSRFADSPERPPAR